MIGQDTKFISDVRWRRFLNPGKLQRTRLVSVCKLADDAHKPVL